MTMFSKKTAKASKAAKKDTYFVHQIDEVNPVFADHPECPLEATCNVPHLAGFSPRLKEGSKDVGAVMVL